MLDWGQRSLSSPWSKRVIYVHVCVFACECATAVTCQVIRVHSTRRLWGPTDLGEEIITQLATMQMTRERWLSMCVEGVCLCVHLCAWVRERETKRDMWAERHPDICQGPLCTHLCACECAQSKAKQPSESPCSYATWQIHSEKCHPHSNYNSSMPSCPAETRGECVRVCVRWAASAPSFQSSHSLHRMPRQQVDTDSDHGRLHDLASWLCTSNATANNSSASLNRHE